MRRLAVPASKQAACNTRASHGRPPSRERACSARSPCNTSSILFPRTQPSTGHAACTWAGSVVGREQETAHLLRGFPVTLPSRSRSTFALLRVALRPASPLPSLCRAGNQIFLAFLRNFSFFVFLVIGQTGFGVVKARRETLEPEGESAHGYGHGASACAAAASRKCECGGHGATGARSVVFCSREQGLRVRSHSLQRCLGKGHHATRRAAMRAQCAHLTA